MALQCAEFLFYWMKYTGTEIFVVLCTVYALCTREWELCWEMTSAQGSHPFIWSWDRVTWPLLTHPLEDAPVCFGNEWVNKQLFTFFSSVA